MASHPVICIDLADSTKLTQEKLRNDLELLDSVIIESTQEIKDHLLFADTGDGKIIVFRGDLNCDAARKTAKLIREKFLQGKSYTHIRIGMTSAEAWLKDRNDYFISDEALLGGPGIVKASRFQEFAGANSIVADKAFYENVPEMEQGLEGRDVKVKHDKFYSLIPYIGEYNEDKFNEAYLTESLKKTKRYLAICLGILIGICASLLGASVYIYSSKTHLEALSIAQDYIRANWRVAREQNPDIQDLKKTLLEDVKDKLDSAAQGLFPIDRKRVFEAWATGFNVDKRARALNYMASSDWREWTEASLLYPGIIPPDKKDPPIRRVYVYNQSDKSQCDDQRAVHDFHQPIIEAGKAAGRHASLSTYASIPRLADNTEKNTGFIMFGENLLVMVNVQPKFRTINSGLLMSRTDDDGRFQSIVRDFDLLWDRSTRSPLRCP